MYRFSSAKIYNRHVNAQGERERVFLTLDGELFEMHKSAIQEVVKDAVQVITDLDLVIEQDYSDAKGRLNPKLPEKKQGLPWATIALALAFIAVAARFLGLI